MLSEREIRYVTLGGHGTREAPAVPSITLLRCVALSRGSSLPLPLCRPLFPPPSSLLPLASRFRALTTACDAARPFAWLLLARARTGRGQNGGAAWGG